MLNPTELIFNGSSRSVYVHPDDPFWLLKVERFYPPFSAPKASLAWRSFFRKNFGFYSMNRAELKAYRLVASKLGTFVPIIRPELENTSLGQALVVSRIMNGCGGSAPSLYQIMQAGSVIEAKTLHSIKEFFEYCNRYEINLFDLNPANFLIRADQTIVFSDLKSLNVDRSMVPLSKVSKSMAKAKRLRRQARLITMLNSYIDR